MPSPHPPLPPGGTVSFAFTSQPLGSPMASRAFQSESIDEKATSRQRGGLLVGGPTSLCQRGLVGGGWWACLLEGPASAALERTRHQLHQRPPSTDSRQSSSQLPTLRSHFPTSPAIAIWLWLPIEIRGCHRVKVGLDGDTTFGEGRAKVLWSWAGWLIQLLARNFQKSCQVS